MSSPEARCGLRCFRRSSGGSDAGGAPHGVGVTIARALAESIGVTLDCTVHGSPPKVVEALAAGCADVALLGIDRARAADVDFSPPLMSADFTYLVPEASAVHVIADADRPGVRIALVRHHAMDGALQLEHAVRVYAERRTRRSNSLAPAKPTCWPASGRGCCPTRRNGRARAC